MKVQNSFSKHRVLNLNKNDITPYKFGEYSSTGSKWVNFGYHNDYPEYLRSLYLNSPTHQAVVDNTINMATGEGVEVVEPEQNPISNKWLNENFPKNIVKKLLGDVKLYGYCVAEVYGGDTVKYVDATKYRLDHKNEHGQVEYMWYSQDWERYTYRKNHPVKVPIYKEGSDEDVSVIFEQIDTKGMDYYSPVDYNATINYISLEHEISVFHLSNIKNGLFPSFIVTFIGTEFSDEQMAEIERDVNNKFGGGANTGRAIIGFASSKEEATQLETIQQSELSEQYQFLTKETSEKILIGHGVTNPILFGIRGEGGLGNNAEELEQSYYLYYESKLKYYQNHVLNLIKKVMDGNMMYADVQFKNYNPFSKDEKTEMNEKNISEVEAQQILSKIDKIKTKTKDIKLSSKLSIEPSEDSLYKFIKASKRNNMVIKKFEFLDKKGYLFKYDKNLIKNTKDYYFIEQKFIKNNE